jgi:hypothetical protein
MQRLQNTYEPAAMPRTMEPAGKPDQADWMEEIRREQTEPRYPVSVGRDPVVNGLREAGPQSEVLDLRSGLPQEVVHNPLSVEEAHMGSWKALLSRNEGNYVVATFLVGTQNTITWEGILYDVGNDYLTIYQESRDRYIVSDYYSLKFVEFYDTQRRRRCAELLQADGWDGGGSGGNMRMRR